MMDRTIVLPAAATPFLPLADASLQDLPPFIALGNELESLTLTGPEAAKFLQGQVTCDVNEVMAGGLRLGAHCNPKGRAQATFLAFASPSTAPDIQTVTLLLPAGMAVPTHQQLKKFAMFSKVTLTEAAAGNGPLPLLLGGRSARATLATLGAPADIGHMQLAAFELRAAGTPVQVTALDADQSVFLLILPPESLPALLAALPADIAVASQNGWWQCLTALGQAHVFPATQEAFIPQEINYDLNQGISFKKGCYKGQEIVARLHFKGTPKFRTGRFQWQGATPPVIGAALMDDNGQQVGQVAQAADTGKAHYEILLVSKPDDPRLEQPLQTAEGVTVQLSRAGLAN